MPNWITELVNSKGALTMLQKAFAGVIALLCLGMLFWFMRDNSETNKAFVKNIQDTNTKQTDTLSQLPPILSNISDGNKQMVEATKQQSESNKELLRNSQEILRTQLEIKEAIVKQKQKDGGT